jgi:soluble lytic murein transglycosylase-like protein
MIRLLVLSCLLALSARASSAPPSMAPPRTALFQPPVGIEIASGAVWKSIQREALFEPAFPLPHGPLARSLAIEAGIPPLLLARLIAYESGWVQNRVGRNSNGTEDYGLMQLNGAYLAEFAWRYNGGKTFDPFDSRMNLRIGTRHLATLYRVTGSWRAAVSAYNCGLSRYRSGKLPASTLRYVEAVYQEGGEL